MPSRRPQTHLFTHALQMKSQYQAPEGWQHTHQLHTTGSRGKPPRSLLEPPIQMFCEILTWAAELRTSEHWTQASYFHRVFKKERTGVWQLGGKHIISLGNSIHSLPAEETSLELSCFLCPRKDLSHMSAASRKAMSDNPLKESRVWVRGATTARNDSFFNGQGCFGSQPHVMYVYLWATRARNDHLQPPVHLCVCVCESHLTSKGLFSRMLQWVNF